MERYQGKKVNIYFYDNPNHVTRKSGLLREIDKSFVSLEIKNSVELISVSKIVRIEIEEGNHA